ncbi:MAG TPA: ribulokinase [Bacteroidales bacterium]
MMNKKLCIGVDFGTDSVRSLLVDIANGEEIASLSFQYPRWNEGLYCNVLETRFRQHPLDYIEGLEFTINDLLDRVPGAAKKVIAIGIATTASTPIAVNDKGVPLALLKEFEDNPNAQFILWKDHTAIPEADEINARCKEWGGIDFTKYSGGIYSSEWFWAKILHVIREDENIKKAAFSWVEHCDWMPALLCGDTNPLSIKRSRCAAGHKAMWHEEWGGLPTKEFLVTLDPYMKDLRDRLYHTTYTCDMPAGTLSSEWAKKLGLSESVIVATGGIDAHIGAVGGGIEPFNLVKVIGTSTCDMLVVPNEIVNKKLIKGICGQVDGSIIPGKVGMEAGQSAFGDIYAWFSNLLLWPLEYIFDDGNYFSVVQRVKPKVIEELSRKASQIPVESSDIIGLDWMNGRRTPDANQNLKGALVELSLGTDAPRIFKALVESTAFGAKKIVERFNREGIPILGIIALGGIAKKNPYVMQVLTDVLNMPVKVVHSEQTCALGASMFASVAAGIYSDISEAQGYMVSGFEIEYKPIPENVERYKDLYKNYIKLGEFVESTAIQKKSKNI